MRRYPRNSPEAAGRILALAMLADGPGHDDEHRELERLPLQDELGLSPQAMQQVLRGLHEDLLDGTPLTWSDVDRIDPDVLAAPLAEIDDATLRLRLLRWCMTLAEADGHVSDGESLMLSTAVEHWNLQRRMLEPAGASA